MRKFSDSGKVKIDRTGAPLNRRNTSNRKLEAKVRSTTPETHQKMVKIRAAKIPP